MVKGNNGKAARSRLLQRLFIVVFACATIIIIYEFSGLKDKKAAAAAKNRSYYNAGAQERVADEIERLRKRVNKRSRQDKGFINYSRLTREEKIDLIVSGQVHLMDIRISNDIEQSEEHNYDGVIGLFCKLEFSLHKSEPSKYPMFRDLVNHSDCNNPIKFDLKEAVHLIKEADKSSSNNNSHTIKPNGFVFHESRCGSTLAANALIAIEPSQNRVYSESSPPISALRVCGLGGKDCPKGTAAKLFKDVIFLMGRTNDVDEKNLFFKIQSIGTKYIDVFLEAFPQTPWIFIYRKPIHIMMSQLAYGVQRANCVHQLRDVPKDTRQMLADMGLSVRDLTPEQKCALHLGLLCENAVHALENSSYGRAVNYEGIINNLLISTIPDHFKFPMNEERKENVLAVGSKYSKGRGDRAGDFKDDNKKKDDAATTEVKDASALFLNELYEQLESFSHKSSQHQ